VTTTVPAMILIAVLGLLGIGIYGLLATRNMINVVIALQIMVKGILVALIWAGHQVGQINVSQSMALTIIVADTIVAVLGLALAVQVRRRFGTLDIKALTTLRR